MVWRNGQILNETIQGRHEWPGGENTQASGTECYNPRCTSAQPTNFRLDSPQLSKSSPSSTSQSARKNPQPNYFTRTKQFFYEVFLSLH